MSAAVKDLPDPLDPSPTIATSNPDDLLAKMADEAIDRLMAEADKGGGAAAPPVPMDAVAEMPPPDATESPMPSVPSAATEIDAVAAPPVALGTSPGAADLPHLPPDEAAPSPVEPPVVEAPAPPAPAADVRALLHDDTPARRPSPLLWPLWLMNLPFAGMSDAARRVVGLLGVVTLVPGAAAIAYVVWLKHH